MFDNKNSKKICIIATVPQALLFFMLPHIKALSTTYHVVLITNDPTETLKVFLNDNVSFIHLRIERKISVFNDMFSWYKLYKILKEQDFYLIHSLMPKTSLLAMTAGLCAAVPKRVHTFTGQVWANKTGFKKYLLRYLDKVVGLCATNLLVDSESQAQFLIKERVVMANKLTVVNKGSICGVDTNRFKPDLVTRQRIRMNYKIKNDAFVFLFVGRLTYDKGIIDLVSAFIKVAKTNSSAYLLLVGPDEGRLGFEIKKLLIGLEQQYEIVGFTMTPENYMACADVFCLPSYREGFGSVLIEAAAVKLPTIASNIYGVVDAMIHNVTGLLHEPKDIEGIANAMNLFLNNSEMCNTMGQAGFDRVHKDFTDKKVIDFMTLYYNKLISNK